MNGWRHHAAPGWRGTASGPGHKTGAALVASSHVGPQAFSEDAETCWLSDICETAGEEI
jgi:hypothetical protein